jgi:hypothetical protein
LRMQLNNFQRKSGGRKGIRTLDTFAGIHTFQACALDRSATHPQVRVYDS